MTYEPRSMDRPLLSFLADDFTGATDALECLASSGIPTLLFMDPADPRAARQDSGASGVRRGQQHEIDARGRSGVDTAVSVSETA